LAQDLANNIMTVNPNRRFGERHYDSDPNRSTTKTP